jgi:hypothetical protein
MAERPDLVAGHDAQPVATIGWRRREDLSAAGELLLHKGPATEDASIGKIAYPATQKLRQWDLALLLLENLLGALYLNDGTRFGSGCSGLEKQLTIFPARVSPTALCS